MTAQVSVILPTFNRSHSLRAAIDSVLMQSYRDLELIVVDDASTEDIEAVVRSIGDERVRYVRRASNGGAAAARNTGLAEARGTYIGFQDSDDLWLPNKLSLQLAAFANLPDDVGAVTGGKILYGLDDAMNYGPGRLSYAPPTQGRLSLSEDQLRSILQENRLSVQNALFRRSCYPDRTWFDSSAKANDDWEFAVRLVQHTLIFEDPEPVLLGFVSVDSISRSSRRKIIGIMRILRKNRQLLEKYPKERSKLLSDVGRFLFKNNKRRIGFRFICASMALYPPYALTFFYRALRTAFTSVAVGRTPA